MTYFEPPPSCAAPHIAKTPNSWLAIAVMRICMAGLCFLLGISRGEMMERMMRSRPGGRAQRRRDDRTARRAVPPGRDLNAIRSLLPRALGTVLSPAQRLERYTRLAAMSRFQIYDFLYYRHDFWRIGALKTRARAPQGASGLMRAFDACGLSAAHAWPD